MSPTLPSMGPGTEKAPREGEGVTDRQPSSHPPAVLGLEGGQDVLTRGPIGSKCRDDRGDIAQAPTTEDATGR